MGVRGQALFHEIQCDFAVFRLELPELAATGSR
jgi:hypothetical protein